MNVLVKNQRRSLVVICLLCLQLYASGQLTAKFTATPQGGCSPLIVHFTDQSTGNPSQWKWDLGNGTTSTLQNPSATYFNPGTYTIKLVIKNPATADSTIKVNYITVYANPVTKFGANDTAGCFPLPVQFTDSSTTSNGSIASWLWDFGDGIISTQQHPLHTYTAAGSYTITLKTTTSFGCSKTVTKSQYINVSSGVTAAFNNTNPTVCAAPFTVQFNNLSTGPGNLAYTWNFGDGSSSTASSPSHTFTNNGSYTISLIASSAQGCKDTVVMTNLLNVGNYNADFTTPLTSCVGEIVSLVNTSSPVPTGAQWFFSDGSSSNALQPVKSFALPGSYSIKLVSSFGNCTDSITKQISIVAKPTVSFSANDTDFCKTPAAVQFTSANTGNLLWNFGDGATSTSQNPTHSYTTEGSYTVTLIVTNNNGCSDTLVKTNYITVKKPAIQLHGLPQTGCAPVTAGLSATVICNEPVQTWLWNFGDGSTSNSSSPSHVYSNAGNYNVSLLIITTGGCTDSVTMVNGVRAGNKPNAQFGALSTAVCNETAVQFLDSSSSNVDQWYWDFGDNLFSSQQNPAHVFNGTGTYTVTMVVWSNTCPDTITRVNYITVLPPTAGLSVVHSCTDKYTKTFVDESQDAQLWHWNFGDGTSSTLQNPVHTYSSPGNYNVILTVTNGVCSNINKLWVKVVDENPAIITNNNICKGVTNTFTTPQVTDSNIVHWQWNLGDGISSTQPAPLNHIYSNSGTYIANLSITDVLGCVSSATDTVNVFGPVAQFQPDKTATCLNGNLVTFTEASVPDGQNPLVQWQWNFGDGTIQNNSTAAGVSHSYLSAGQYTVSLAVKDAWGCKDSVSFSPLIIAQPQAAFYSPDTLSCTGQTISFVNQSIGYSPLYNWNFGDGTYSSLSAPVHQYNSVGIFHIGLSVTDQYGCKDSLVINNYIDISLPNAVFTVSDSVGNCPPLLVHFTNSSTHYTSASWIFGDGSSSSLQNPSHYYTVAGTYYAKLIVTGPGGCSDTAIQKIVVKGPTGTISYTPLIGCNPLTVNFTVAAQNSSSYIWDFSDGSTQVSTVSTATHIYTTAGDYIPKIILTDTAGCNVPIIGTDTIRVVDVLANFAPDVVRLCDHGNIYFTNTSVANDFITGYHWNFGDGSTSSVASPVHYYDGPGVYQVQLVVTTSAGCIDTIYMSPTITVWEKPEIQIGGNNSACMPATMNFNGVVIEGNPSTLAWSWNFGNSQAGATQNPAAPTYTADGTYTVTATVVAPYGCSDTATKNITVHPLPETNAGTDVSICKGGSVQLNAVGANSYTWNQAASLTCTSCASPSASPASNTTYVVTGTSAFGCTRKDSVIVTVYQDLVLKVSSGDTICVGEKVTLSASGAETYTWYPANTIQNPNGSSATATPSTSTTYHVIGRDSHNCFSDTADVFIKVWPIPTVNAGADQELVVGDALQLSATTTGDVNYFHWSSAGTLSCASCPVTLAKPKQTTTYYIQVKNAGGCTAQDNITVTVICNNGNLFIPNAFSPNGDGVNDLFYPSGRGINMIKTLRIYNRWGQVVFERMNFSANDAAAGWDGKFKGQVLPPDVYVYACDVVCQNNEILSFKGDITLLR